MTASEAKALGFADRVDSRRVSASMRDDKNLVVNGLSVDLSTFKTQPRLQGGTHEDVGHRQAVTALHDRFLRGQHASR